MYKHVSKRTLAIIRAVAVMGGTAALVVGATFAATVGTASLTGNTFSATQGLTISTDGSTFSGSVTGFNFGNVPTGTTGSAVQTFYLEDVSGGDTPLGVSVAASTCGTFTGLDPTMVNVNIEEESGTTPSGTVDTATLSDLCGSSPLTLSTANEPATGSTPTKYQVWLTMGSSAVTGTPSATTNGFDLNFTGSNSST